MGILQSGQSFLFGELALTTRIYYSAIGHLLNRLGSLVVQVRDYSECSSTRLFLLRLIFLRLLGDVSSISLRLLQSYPVCLYTFGNNRSKQGLPCPHFFASLDLLCYFEILSICQQPPDSCLSSSFHRSDLNALSSAALAPPPPNLTGLLPQLPKYPLCTQLPCQR